MKKIDFWLDKYAESHQNSTNKLIHWFCVPIITFTLLGLLSFIKFSFLRYNINFSYILFLFALLFYIRLSLSLTIGMGVFAGGSILIINKISHIFTSNELITYYIIAFIVAWIGQFIGHKIEGKKPSFVEDIKFLLIGPAWLLSFVYKKFNIKI
tara:strand:- start:1820 stop:2281 length:462 start_codon:yes stop_codon:yes gene_type:complete